MKGEPQLQNRLKHARATGPGCLSKRPLVEARLAIQNRCAVLLEKGAEAAAKRQPGNVDSGACSSLSPVGRRCQGSFLQAGVLFICLVFAGVLRSADAPSPATPTPSGPRPKPPAEDAADTDLQIEKLIQYVMPGKAHALLERMAGRWETRTRYWMKPGAEPVESKGTSTRKWILERRFLLEELDGGNLALPFQGVGLYGYDAFEQQYTSAWVDTMSTAILTNLGRYDKTNDLVQFTGQYKDPWSGRKKPNRGVTRFVSSDQHVLELHVTEPDGREFKMLEITYTRAASAPPAAPNKR
jgi:hypothetical protein